LRSQRRRGSGCGGLFDCKDCVNEYALDQLFFARQPHTTGMSVSMTVLSAANFRSQRPVRLSCVRPRPPILFPSE